jgi:peptidoglycan hydrolase CwlO-like protein
MRCVIHKLAFLVAALMLVAVPVRAEERVEGSAMRPAEQGVKNECLLVAMNCANQVDSIQERIDRLQNEIRRGTDVYTNDELKKLQDKLDDANRTFNDLQYGS